MEISSRRYLIISSGLVAWCGGCASGKTPHPESSTKSPNAPSSGNVSSQATAPPQPEAVNIVKYKPRPWTFSVNYFTDSALNRMTPELLRKPVRNERAQVERPGRSPIILDSYDDDNVYPKHVQFIHRCVRHSQKEMKKLGFRDPVAFDIYLQDLSETSFRGATHPFSGRINLEMSLSGEDAYATIVHEVFHRIQYAYNNADEWSFWPPLPIENMPYYLQPFVIPRSSILEGSARFAEKVLVPGYDRYQNDAAEWFKLDSPSLFSPESLNGRDNQNNYMSVLFWQFVAEQYGKTESGMDTQKVFLENIEHIVEEEDKSTRFKCSPDILRSFIYKVAQYGHFDKFLHVAGRGPACTESTWANFLVALAIQGSAERDRRYVFRDAPTWRGTSLLRPHLPRGNVIQFGALPISEGDVAKRADEPNRVTWHAGGNPLARQRDWVRRNFLAWPWEHVDRQKIAALGPYSVNFFRVDVQEASSGQLLRVQIHDRLAMPDAFVQIVVMDRSERIADLIRADLTTPAFEQIVACEDAAHIFIIVATREHGGRYSLSLSQVADRALLQATSWNAIPGRSQALDPRAFRWTWRAHDFYLNAPNAGAAGENGKLTLRLRNLGSAPARNVQVKVKYSKLTSVYSESSWQDLPQPYMWPDDGKLGDSIRVDPRGECRRRNFYAIESVYCTKAPNNEEIFLRLDWSVQKLLARDVALMAVVTSPDNAPAQPLVVMCSPFGTPLPRPDPSNLQYFRLPCDTTQECQANAQTISDNNLRR